MEKIKAHRVECQFCNAKVYVKPKAMICPRCYQYGFLEWADDDCREVEIEADKVEVAPEEAAELGAD